MDNTHATERNRFLIIVLMGGLVALGLLLALAPAMVPFAGIAVILIFCAMKLDILMWVILAFAVVSTLPGIAGVADTVKVEFIPGVATDFLGLLRTLLAGLMIVRLFLFARERWPLIRRDGLCLVLLWAYAVVSLTWSPDWALGESLRLVVYLSLAVGIFFATLQVGLLKRDNLALLKKFMWLAVIVGVGSLLKFDFLPEISSMGENDLDRGERLIGLAVSPNVLAANLAVFMSLAMALLVVPGIQKAWRRGAMAVMAVCALPLLFTYSRSGWVGAALAMTLALVMQRKWRWLLGFGLAMAILLFGTTLGQRFLGDWQSVVAGADLMSTRGYQNAHGRIDLVWSQALQELVTPFGIVVGRGAGVAQAWAYRNTGDGMHSEFLQIWLDFGFLGLGLLLLAFIIVIRRAYRLFRDSTDPIAKALGLASLCALAAMLPCFAWQHVFNAPSSWLLLIIWGLTLGAEQWAITKETAPTRAVALPPALRYGERFRIRPIGNGKGTQPA